MDDVATMKVKILNLKKSNEKLNGKEGYSKR